MASFLDLPESLIFKVSYLGGEMPTFALNFSRPGAQVLLQYYMFLRLGFDGYRRVQQTSHDVAKYLSGEIEQMDDFYAVERRFRHSGVRMDAQRQAGSQVESVRSATSAAHEGMAGAGLSDAGGSDAGDRAAHCGA